MRVSFDLDGVLADWILGVVRLFDTSRETVYDRFSTTNHIYEAIGVSKTEMWERIDLEGPDFWANLDPIQQTLKLWHDLCSSGVACRILTSPSQHPDSAAGKLRWMQTYLGGPKFTDFFMGKNKHELANPNTLLIDDRPKLVEDFKNAGGHAFLFPTAQNGTGYNRKIACLKIRSIVEDMKDSASKLSDQAATLCRNK